MLLELQGSPTTSEAQMLHVILEHQVSGKEKRIADIHSESSVKYTKKE